MRDTKQDILSFWFAECHPQQWFGLDPQFDDEIAQRFLLNYEMACDGLNDQWAADASGCLALCLLLDQFPRHMFRATSRMFATDMEAVAIAKHALLKGFDLELPPEQRLFLYMPFTHSEKASDQKRSITLFEGLAEHDPRRYEVVQKRFEVFSRFGRFPQRNAVLGRQSSKEELLYLAESDLRF